MTCLTTAGCSSTWSAREWNGNIAKCIRNINTGQSQTFPYLKYVYFVSLPLQKYFLYTIVSWTEEVSIKRRQDHKKQQLSFILVFALSLFRSGKVPAVLYLGSPLLLHFESHHNTTGWSCCRFSPAVTRSDLSWCQSGWEAIKAQRGLSCLGTSNLPWAQQGSQAALRGKMGQHLSDLWPALTELARELQESK